MSQRQQPQHQHPLPVEASRLRDGISSAVHAARAASSRSIPTPVPSAPRPRPANDAGPASFSQRHAEFRSFTPQQQNQKQQRRPAPGSNSSNSLKKLVAGLKEIHRAAPENDTAVLSREVREWYRERKEAKRDDVATQVRAYVKLQQREEEEVQRLLRMQEEQYRWRQEQLLQQQQQREEEQEREAQVMPTIEVTSAPEEDWRSGKGSESPPEQFYDFVVRERATEGQTRMPPGTGAIVPAATVRHHEVHEEPLPQVQAYYQGGFVNQPPEHRPPINRAAPRAGRLLYASERMCYGPNEPLPTRPSQPDDLEVLVSKLQDFKADIMEGRQRHKAAKAARRLASQQSKQNEAREKWRQEMKGRIGGPRLLVAGEEQRGISAGVRQSLDEISPVRSPISPLRRHSIASPVVLTRPAAPPGRIHVPQVLPSPLESRKSSPPAFYSHAHNASRVTQWDDFVNPRATPPPPVVPAPPGTAASSSSVALTAASTRGILSSSSTVSLSTSPAPVSSKPPFSISTSTPKSALSSLHFKPTLPKLFTRGIAALPKHHHHHVSTTSSGASSSFGCRGISAGAEAKGVAAMMMMRAARAASVASSQQGEGAGRDAPFRSPFAPIRHVSPLAVEFGEQRKRRASYSSSVSSLGSVEEADAAARRYSVVAAVPSPLNVRKTVTPLTATAKAPPPHHQSISVGLQVAAGSEEQQQRRYDSRLSASSSSSSNYNQETTRGIRSRSRSAGASSTFSRPSWWTWESPSPSPISSSRQPTHRHRGMQPSLPNLLVSDVDAKTASHQRPYPESDSDAESLYKAPPPPLPRRVATPAPAEPYVPPRQNWTATSTTTANASASSFSSGNGSSSSGSSGSGMRNTAVKEKTRFWDEVRKGLRPSNASFVRSVVGQQQQRNRGRDDGR